VGAATWLGGTACSLMSPSGVKVDLLFASSGIEAEIVDRTTPTDFEGAGSVPVANAEELLAMKVSSIASGTRGAARAKRVRSIPPCVGRLIPHRLTPSPAPGLDFANRKERLFAQILGDDPDNDRRMGWGT